MDYLFILSLESSFIRMKLYIAQKKPHGRYFIEIIQQCEGLVCIWVLKNTILDKIVWENTILEDADLDHTGLDNAALSKYKEKWILKFSIK